jgi:hypothetical protein
LQRRILADAKPRCVHSVRSWQVLQRAKSVRVLQVRGGAVLGCQGCDGRRNLSDMLDWHVVGGGKCNLQPLSFIFQFNPWISSSEKLQLQSWSNRARRSNVCVVPGREIQGAFGQRNVCILRRRHVFSNCWSQHLHQLHSRQIFYGHGRFFSRHLLELPWKQHVYSRQHCFESLRV